ncbi:hypothetical protein [Streptomyces sp. NBC_00557]|uniref:hypothetical protein n=1 Tax=Streptomyces sp. NBC_00557 TaxID=2975776 RepID=UPI002E7FEE52|nr:hypothetical protein [Streptomyces sp. NBC_00557]WUC38346.1 hypothetical protein OG956_31010 [Streptomyces sp. NBC_00557]
MHRTTTTAALLATVAVSALSGCVTVQAPATPAPPREATTSVPAAPRTDGSAGPRPVPAPAQEALEMTGPTRHPRHPAPAGPPHRPEAPPVAHRPPAPPHRHTERPRRPHTDVPDRSRPAGPAPDVCALGRTYGGWRADSPEARICDQAYGR